MVDDYAPYRTFVEARDALLQSISDEVSIASREYYRSKFRELAETDIEVIHGVAEKLQRCGANNRTLSKDDMFSLAKKLYGINIIRAETA